MYAGFGAMEEMSPATANPAALQYVFHVSSEYEAHTISMIHHRKPTADFYAPSSNHLIALLVVPYHS
jgi:hypothetical protein